MWNYGNRDYEPLTWTGACTDGKASGEGRLVFRSGEGVYDGAMQDGKMHGSGVLDWANGFRYEGELRDGKQHGHGTLTQTTGARYVGAWRNGRPHGQGTYTQPDGSTFEGAWRNGLLRRAHRPVGLDRDDGGGLRLRVGPSGATRRWRCDRTPSRS